MVKRKEFQDYFNDNYMSVGANSKGSYVSFYSEDLESGESVQINLSAESVNKLVNFVNGEG